MTTVFGHRPAVLAVFALTYIGVAIGHVPGLRLNRTGIALVGAIAVIVLTGTSAAAAVSWVNWPTMFILFGFFVLSSQLRLCGLYDRIAMALSRGITTPRGFLLALMAASAALSAFLNNDVVCYVFTPIVGAAVAKRDMNPVPFLVCLATASNIGAAATLIGNAQGILISEVAHLGFAQHLLWGLTPVVLSLAGAYGIGLAAAGRTASVAMKVDAPAEIPEYPFNRGHAVKGVVIFFIVIVLYLTRLPKELVVILAAAIHLSSRRYRTEDLLGLVDWQILILFMSLFVVTGAFQQTGYAQQFVAWLTRAGFDPAKLGNEAILTALLTTAINNAPAVMLLLKLVSLATPAAASVMVLANGFSGNLFLTASVSNLIVVQQARRQGIAMGFSDFAKVGIPVGLLSLAILLGWICVAA